MELVAPSAITCAFHKRLRYRGFSQDLLRRAFERAPSYDQRSEILSKIESSFDADAAPLPQTNTCDGVLASVLSCGVRCGTYTCYFSESIGAASAAERCDVHKRVSYWQQDWLSSNSLSVPQK